MSKTTYTVSARTEVAAGQPAYQLSVSYPDGKGRVLAWCFEVGDASWLATGAGLAAPGQVERHESGGELLIIGHSLRSRAEQLRMEAKLVETAAERLEWLRQRLNHNEP